MGGDGNVSVDMRHVPKRIALVSRTSGSFPGKCS